jgi:Tfp pilus assembly protein PilN
VYAQAAAAEAMLTEAMGEEVRYSRFLSDLSLTVPENVWLKSLTFTQADAATPAVGATEPAIGSVTVTGVGFSHDDVAVWLESLAGQSGYTNPYFSSSTESLIGTRTSSTSRRRRSSPPMLSRASTQSRRVADMDKIKQWVIMAVLASLVIVAAGWFLAVSPKRAEAADLRAQAAEQVAANATLETQLQVLQAQAKELPKEQAKLAAVAAKIPDNPALPSLVRALLEAAESSGVELVSISPGVPEILAPVAAEL